jgi:hypothetical protein
VPPELEKRLFARAACPGVQIRAHDRRDLVTVKDIHEVLRLPVAVSAGEQPQLAGSCARVQMNADDTEPPRSLVCPTAADGCGYGNPALANERELHTDKIVKIERRKNRVAAILRPVVGVTAVPHRWQVEQREAFPIGNGHDIVSGAGSRNAFNAIRNGCTCRHGGHGRTAAKRLLQQQHKSGGWRSIGESTCSQLADDGRKLTSTNVNVPAHDDDFVCRGRLIVLSGAEHARTDGAAPRLEPPVLGRIGRCVPSKWRSHVASEYVGEIATGGIGRCRRKRCVAFRSAPDGNDDR